MNNFRIFRAHAIWTGVTSGKRTHSSPGYKHTFTFNQNLDEKQVRSQLTRLHTKNTYLLAPAPRSSGGITIGGFQLETGSASSLSSSSPKDVSAFCWILTSFKILWRHAKFYDVIQKLWSHKLSLTVIGLFFFLFIIFIVIFDLVGTVAESGLSDNIIRLCTLDFTPETATSKRVWFC